MQRKFTVFWVQQGILKTVHHTSQPWKNRYAKCSKKNTPFKWEQDEAKAYQILKDSVIKDELDHFNIGKLTELWVDASPVGCASFLIQVDPKTNERKLIKCGRHAFTAAELNYSHLEKEAFAIA